MARFDVYRGDDSVDYFLDCQADSLRHFESRFVIPLLLAEPTLQADRLHPIFEIDGVRVVMVTQLASAVPARALRGRIGSLNDRHFEIIAALDVLIGGV